MARKAPKIALSQEEREYLQALITRHTAEQREVLRTRIVLSVDEEKENQEIAKELGVIQDIVGKWRTRSFHRGKEGLEDKPRLGKPKKFDHEYVRHGTKSLLAAFLAHKGRGYGKML